MTAVVALQQVHGGQNLPGWFFALIGAGLLAVVFWPHRSVGSRDGPAVRADQRGTRHDLAPRPPRPHTTPAELIAEGFRAGSAKRWK